MSDDANKDQYFQTKDLRKSSALCSALMGKQTPHFFLGETIMTDVSSGDLAQFPGQLSIKTSLVAPFCSLWHWGGSCRILWEETCRQLPQYNCD